MSQIVTAALRVQARGRATAATSVAFKFTVRSSLPHVLSVEGGQGQVPRVHGMQSREQGRIVTAAAA